MSLVRLTGWLRPVAMLLALTGTLGLTACGGGSGAVNGPTTPTTPIATLYTLPAGIVVAYSQVPATIKIVGGVAPYHALSNNSAVLPVPLSVSDDTIVEHIKTVAFYELIDEGGAPAILSMFYDITEQNKAQEALVQSEARVRALLEATPDMIFELTRSGTIVQFIPSADNDLFLQRDELIGKTLAQIFPSIADQAGFAIGRALASGQVNAFEYRCRAPLKVKILRFASPQQDQTWC